MINIVKYRYLFFGISLLVIVPGLIALILWGLPVGIEFTGGSLLDLRFESGKVPAVEDVRQIYSEFGFEGVEIQTTSQSGLIIRSKDMDETAKGKIVAAIDERFGSPATVQRFDQVGPSVGQEVARSAALAVAVAALAILAYITFAFRGVKHAFRYGVSAIIALLHDVLVVVGIEAILGHYMGWEVGPLFLTALLTVIGFSVHDTIVVYDRIRENSIVYPRLQYEKVVNHSIVQTLSRSINTQLTVMFTLFSLVLFGGETIQHFVVILLIGIFSGTYSSIFNAAPILVVWENREWRTWFRSNKNQVTT